ncbi:MAG TPA: class I SAM-dependent methyltransferase [Candidatus Eisenbacteria bacterium]|nr:class I SAM-dependent methyltransferase [Candidatus Eisenbacteria bacterium]
MKTATRVLLALNRFAPRPNFPPRPTPAAYAGWEYREAEYQVSLMKRAGVSYAVSRVLDLGCGLGGKSVYFAERGAGYLLGLDLLASNARAAREFAVERGAGNVEFAAADAARLPVRSASFDLVITTDTFEHFQRPEAALAEMARVLRPGGRLVAIFGPFGSPLGSHLYDTIFVPWCQMLFSRDTLAEAIREIARRRSLGLDPEGSAEAARRAEERIAYFDHELNRMTLRRFRRVVRANPSLRLLAWNLSTPPKLRLLTPLLMVPGLYELVTGLLVMVAERVV